MTGLLSFVWSTFWCNQPFVWILKMEGDIKFIYLQYLCINLWKIFLFLSFSAISRNLIDTQIWMCTITQSNSCWESAHFFHDNTVVHVSKASAVMFLCWSIMKRTATVLKQNNCVYSRNTLKPISYCIMPWEIGQGLETVKYYMTH